jgi:hypothetical protein
MTAFWTWLDTDPTVGKVLALALVGLCIWMTGGTTR